MFRRRILFLLFVLALMLSPLGMHSHVAATAATVAFTGQTPPELVAEVDPSLDLENFHPLDAFIVRFNQPMDPDSDPEPVLTYPYVAGECEWNDDRTELKFRQEGGFSPGKRYLIYLGASIRSIAGSTFASQPNWAIVTANGPSMTHMRRASIDNTLFPETVLSFDVPMNRNSVSAAIRIVPDVTLDLSWNGSRLTIKPAQALQPGARYHLTLLAGQTGARSTEGLPMANPYQWDWTMPDLLVQTQHIKENSVSIVSNYVLDSQKTGFPYQIVPEVSGKWKWLSKTSLRFEADTNFLPNQQYQLQLVSPLYTETGEDLGLANELSFLAPLPFGDIFPKKEKHLYDYHQLNIAFTRPMNKLSIENAFSISPPVHGSFRWIGNKLTFHFTNQLQIGDPLEYEITLDTTAKDEDGNQILAKPFMWTYTIPSRVVDRYYEEPLFGYGAMDQVIDVNGRRAVHIYALSDWITFKLFRLNLSQYSTMHAAFNGNESRSDHDWQKYMQDLELSYRWAYSYKKNGIDEVIIPPEVTPGLYIMEASGLNGSVNRLFIILTSNTLLVKRSQEEIWVWMNDINGDSVSNREVRLYSQQGQHIQGCKTDENGFCHIMIPQSYSPMFLAGLNGADDITISGVSQTWRDNYYWYYGYWGGRRLENNRQKVYIYTERPIYRPGHEVHFKAILRNDRDVYYTLMPAGTLVDINVRDGRDNIIQSMQSQTNGFGTINGSFSIDEGAMLGDYFIEVIVEGNRYTHSFLVQEYRKPDFTVKVTTDSTRYIGGDYIPVNVEVRTFFGMPVTNAKVEITGYPEMNPLRGVTDAEGQFNASLHTQEPYYYNREWGTSSKYSNALIQVKVDDGSHQDVVSTIGVRVYNSPERFRMERTQIIRPNKPFEIQIVTETLDGDPVPNRELELQLRQYGEKQWDWSKVVDNVKFTTGEDGTAAFTWQVEKAGYYKLYLVSRNEENKIVSELEDYIYVFSHDDWRETLAGNFDISVEREQYKPYENANIAIQSTFDGPALLTFERGRVIHSQWINLTAPLTTINVPVIPEYAPNVFITVSAYQVNNTFIENNKDIYWSMSQPDSLLATVSAEIRVDASEKALQIEVTPDAEIYAPGQQASFTVLVVDQGGIPLEAELSVAVVDEAIFKISEEIATNIFAAFYGPRLKTVQTSYSFGPRRWFYQGGGGGGGSDEQMELRSDFPDTVVWVPVLKTDKNGRAIFTIQLPDTLTSWRVTVKAVTASTHVAEHFINVETRKDVVVRPVLPPAMVTGDEGQLGALVQNYSDEIRSFKVSMYASLVEASDQVHTVTLSPGESRLVNWNVKALKAGEASFVFRANAGDGYQDAVRAVMTIHPLIVLDLSSQTGNVIDEKKLTLPIPENALNSSMIEIELNRSISGSLLEGLEYLAAYPYGCVEQMLSKTLPNAAVGRVLSQLGVSDTVLAQRLPGYIQHGVTRLSAMQQGDGGWGWWYDDAGNEYLTSLVIFGLAITSELGYPVPSGILKRGADWILQHYDGIDANSKAFALYALTLTGYGQPDLSMALYQQAVELDTFSQAVLALTLDIEGQTNLAQAILTILSNTAVVQGDEVFWIGSTGKDADSSRSFESPVRNTAMALSVFVRLSENDARIPGMVRYLMNQRVDNAWQNTSDTTFVILALTDYVVKEDQKSNPVVYEVELNGLEIASGEFTQGIPTVKIQLPVQNMRRGLEVIKLKQQGANHLYYRITSRLELEQAAVPSAGKFSVERRYLDPKSGAPLTSIVPGQLVKVSLKVQMPQNMNYIIVEDYLPGGLEAVNESMNNTSYSCLRRFFINDSGWYCESVNYTRTNYSYNQKEVRPDRVTFFITEPESGARTYEYLARVTHIGTFVALPAKVEAMYSPENWGRSKSDIITIVKPEPQPDQSIEPSD